MTIEKPKHIEFANRLNILLTEGNKKVSDLRAAAGVSHEMARRYTLGTAFPREDKLNNIADWLQTTKAYLAYGHDPQDDKGRQDFVIQEAISEMMGNDDAFKGKSNLLEVTSTNQVPLLLWDDVANWDGSNNFVSQHSYIPIEAHEHITAITTEPSKSAFALRIMDDSMIAINGDYSFPEGTIIICDPQIKPDMNKFAIAVDLTSKKATFKKLTGDGLARYLTPLNNAYPVTKVNEETMKIIGKVIEFQINITQPL